MNRRERIVLYFLIFALLVGIIINLIQKEREKRNIQPIQISDISASGGPTPQIPTETEDSSKSPQIKGGFQESSKKRPAIQIDINRATVSELELLPGIGPVLAKRIVDYREKIGRFNKKEELLEIHGIGKKRYEKIKEKILIF